MLSRIFGWDRERIRELETRMARLEGSLKQSREQELELTRRIEALGDTVMRVGAADAKLAQGLMELVRIMEQGEVGAAGGSREEARLSPSPEVEDEILRLLRENGSATPRAIAEKLGKTREHVSRTLRSMAERGKIVRRLDGRVFVYSIRSEP